MTLRDWLVVFFGLIGAWNIVNTWLQARYNRMQRLDAPRSDRVVLEDLAISLAKAQTSIEELRRDMEVELRELKKRTSTVPNIIQARLGELELKTEQRWATLRAETDQGKADHERYEFAMQDLTSKISHIEGRLSKG